MFAAYWQLNVEIYDKTLYIDRKINFASQETW
jgi:hypothetical protein